jgi:predicted Zn-dependent peptidase
MRTLFLTLAAALAAALAPVAALAQPFPPAPPIGDLKPFKSPAAETYALPNGLMVTLIPYGIAPKVIASLRIEAGEVDAAVATTLGAVTADMLKEGAGSRNALQLAQSAAGMGGDLSVTEGVHATVIMLDILSERVGDAIALIGDLARNPSLPADALDRVKANRLRNLSVALSDAGTIAEYAAARAIYPGHPYGAIPDPALIQGYTLDQVKAFHAANFGAGRAHLYIVGRFDTGATKAAIDRAFATWARGNARNAPPAHPVAGPQVVLVDRPGAPQSTVRISFPVPLKTDADEAKLEVTDALLGGAFSSRITKNIRENKGYTYSPYSYIDFNRDVARWSEVADVTTAVTGASLHEIWSEIRGLQVAPPGADETVGIKTYQAGLFTLLAASPSGVLNQVVERDALHLPPDWLDGYVQRLLAVTPADVTATANARFTIPTQTLVVVGDLKTVLAQLQAQPELKGQTFMTVTVP